MFSRVSSKMVRTKVEQVLCKSPTLSLSFSLPQFKIRNDKLNIAKISVTKLSKIVDPQSKLRKAVLINNTLKNLQKHPDVWTMDSGGFQQQEEKEEENNDQKTENYQTPVDKTLSSCALKCDQETNNNNKSLSEDMLTLYDDIVNDIFGNTDNSSEMSQNKSEDQEKENVIENYKEPYSWSPYSYSSFLSELYTVANNEKLQS